jgi:hypothetical protein
MWKHKFQRLSGEIPSNPFTLLTACDQVVSSGFLSYPDYCRLRAISGVFTRHCTPPPRVYGVTKMYLANPPPASDSSIEFSEVMCHRSKTAKTSASQGGTSKSKGTKRSRDDGSLPGREIRCERLTMPLGKPTTSKIQFMGVKHVSVRGSGDYAGIKAKMDTLLLDKGQGVTTFVSHGLQLAHGAVHLTMPRLEKLLLHGTDGLPYVPLSGLTTLSLVLIYGFGARTINQLRHNRERLSKLETLNLLYQWTNRVDWLTLQWLGVNFPAVNITVYVTLEFCTNISEFVPLSSRVKLVVSKHQPTNFPFLHTILPRNAWPMSLE